MASWKCDGVPKFCQCQGCPSSLWLYRQLALHIDHQHFTTHATERYRAAIPKTPLATQYNLGLPHLAQEGTTASLCVHPPETNRANTALLVVAILFLRLGWTTRAGLVRKNAKKWYNRSASRCNDYNIDNNHYINTLWTHSEYTLNTLWTYSEHTLNILWRYAQDSNKSHKITHWLSNMDQRDASASKNMSWKYTSASIMINFKWVAELRNTFITKTVLVRPLRRLLYFPFVRSQAWHRLSRG